VRRITTDDTDDDFGVKRTLKREQLLEAGERYVGEFLALIAGQRRMRGVLR
jgi:hypothetical protein